MSAFTPRENKSDGPKQEPRLAVRDPGPDLRPMTASAPPPQPQFDQVHYYPQAQVQLGPYYPYVRSGVPPGVQQMIPPHGQNMAQNAHISPEHNMSPGVHPSNMVAHGQSLPGPPTPGHHYPNQQLEYPHKIAPIHYEKGQANYHPAPSHMIHQHTPGSIQESAEYPGFNPGMVPGKGHTYQAPTAHLASGSVGEPDSNNTPQAGAPHARPGLAHGFSQGPDASRPSEYSSSHHAATAALHNGRSGRTLANPRKRSHTACDSCRHKKIKCDNVRPQCGACKRNNVSCRFRSDEPSADGAGLELASASIMAKLDVILSELRDSPQTDRPLKRLRKERRSFRFLHCLWDMSVTSVLRWGYLQKIVGTNPDDAEVHAKRLLHDYERVKTSLPLPNSLTERCMAYDSLEKLLHHNFSAFTNSFLINCHTKVPCVDIITLIESLEIYTLMKRADENFSFMSMLGEYFRLESTEQVSASYKAALAKCKIEDSPIRQRLYRQCCQSVPLLLVICAIGALATPIRLDNIGTFALSLEERADVNIGCADFSSASELIPRDRFEVSQMLLNYALILTTIFPNSLRPNSVISVEYHILLSQYHHYSMNPLKAHAEIVLASTNMMYFLQKEAAGESPSKLPEYVLSGKRLIVDRLFWTCLKLECELQSELSPLVPLSGITQMTPPSPFMKIPDPLLEEDHLWECFRLANKYDDNNSWFFFLTEIAVRKVDNKLFDEIYSLEGSKAMLWDQPKFAEETVWCMLIKYLNQYNGIISSLSPQIQRFVLLEINVEEIYSIIKKRADKKRKRDDVEEDIFENLDEFLIDDDLLLRAQSESVMFIKTRIITSKLALFRPLIYMFLEDKVLFVEIVEAAAAVLPQIQISQSDQVVLQDHTDSPFTTSSTTNEESHETASTAASNYSNFLGDDISHFGITSISHSYMKRFPDDDFSDLIEPNDGCDEYDENFIRIKDIQAARKRLLRVFIRNFVTLPKLNIPKIGLHRHAGSWYYIRNLFLGVMVQFLLFKKVQESVIKMMAMATETEAKQHGELFEALNSVFSRDVVKVSLEHSLLIINYWKDERKDCQVYEEYIQRCLNNL